MSNFGESKVGVGGREERRERQNKNSSSALRANRKKRRGKYTQKVTWRKEREKLV